MIFTTRWLGIVVVTLVLLGCRHERHVHEEVLTLRDSSLYLGVHEEMKLEVDFKGNGYPSSHLIWESDHPAYAVVSEVGMVKGLVQGHAVIRVMTSDGTYADKCNVRIHPTNHLFDEPAHEFGMSKEEVITGEPRELEVALSDKLIFKGDAKPVKKSMYFFEKGCLVTSAVLLQVEEVEYKKVKDFLLQRYFSLGIEKDIYFMTEGKMLIGLAIEQNGQLSIVYLEEKVLNAKGIGKYTYVKGIIDNVRN
ncbi:hypothetical protein DN752_14615 [Echinicola strongylocentroti]|uniref:BIG2 domain-containing protein n=1 Tax=Echinicola strongylocentroti TaxID=1795355 RepID=A0A2Z4IKI7_9BACT|nr:hypothetical protein [Echinicola strongylocentroti]AWW31257.1 hypothetical protein DN752_14615 [Echinicola strongylocentroti]